MGEVDGLRDAIRLLVGIQQDRDIENLLKSLSATPDLVGTPMPDTAHPALTHVADYVRSCGLRTVAVPGRSPDRLRWQSEAVGPSSATTTRTALLHQRKCFGLAPYVGGRFVYVWDAWVDDHGRSVCGSASLVRLP